MEAVSLLTIKSKIPLYKGEDLAERVELIELEEVGFEIVSQKDLYKVGDKAVYIQPDYCLSDIPLFESFIRPGGDESKSMLGKVGGEPRRIRAKKFNLHKGDGLPVYSNGILLPLQEVCEAVPEFMSKEKSFMEALGITKYEEPEINTPGLKGGNSIRFPNGVIRTDEENFNNLIHQIEKKLPLRLIGRQKIDGSSITLWSKDNKEGIASRNLGKPLIIKKVKGRRKKTFLEKLIFWKKYDLNIYEQVENDSDFVKYGKPYLDKLTATCRPSNFNLVLQGELCGEGMKGSGNKNNPTAKLPTDIVFFNVCTYEDGQSVRQGEDYFRAFCDNLGLPVPKIYFDKVFNTIEEIREECNNIFKEQLIEGIVIRDENHNFSCKYMSLEYDSKK